MDIKTIYEDADVLVADKPVGVVVFPEIWRVSETRQMTRQIYSTELT